MDRLRALTYGTVLLLCIGWVLHVGKPIFVPAVFGAVVVYIIVGLADALGRLPGLGRTLPSGLRYLVSFAVIGLIGFLFAYLVMANQERALALAPQYQQSLLAAIQGVAVYFGFETEPTWATLRQDLLARINLQRLFGSLLTSVGSIVADLRRRLACTPPSCCSSGAASRPSWPTCPTTRRAWRASARSSAPSTSASVRTWR